MKIQKLMACAVLLSLWACGNKPEQQAEEPVARPERTELRAYHGAPPVIPHDLRDSGRKNCLSCHGPGVQTEGKVIGAVSPHPTWEQCQQCHVARETDQLFRENTLVALGEPAIIQMPSPFLPPYIPHRLDNFRELACEVCHINPGSRLDLRPKHGPRPNCRQCHIPTDNQQPGFRAEQTPFQPLSL